MAFSKSGHGYGFGGCHCRFGRRRLGALRKQLGAFAGEGRLEEPFDRMVVLDGHGLLDNRSGLAVVGGGLDQGPPTTPL